PKRIKQHQTRNTMNAPLNSATVLHAQADIQKLAARLRHETEGEVLFDDGSRGRYSTDASIYQITPVGVLIPKIINDVRIALDLCRELKIPLLARGAGTSQCGQTVGAALVIDNSKHLNGISNLDLDAMTVCVEPGTVLDHLN